MQFGSPAGDVDRRNIGRCQHLETLLHHVAGHHLSTVRAGIHVAMAAGLVALLADIDLQDVNAGGAKGVKARLGEGLLERSGERDGGQCRSLLRAGRKRCVLLLKCG